MPTYLPPRRGISYSVAVAESRTWARVDEPELLTLALHHPAFVDDDGNAIAIYLVNDLDPLAATLEADAPMQGGESVTFMPMPMRVVFPEEADESRDPGAQIQIDDVARVLAPHLRAAAASQDPVQAIARTYLPSDTSAPHEMPPLRLELTGASTDGVALQISAGYGNVVNYPFPSVRYTPEDFPALAAAR